MWLVPGEKWRIVLIIREAQFGVSSSPWETQEQGRQQQKAVLFGSCSQPSSGAALPTSGCGSGSSVLWEQIRRKGRASASLLQVCSTAWPGAAQAGFTAASRSCMQCDCAEPWPRWPPALHSTARGFSSLHHVPSSPPPRLTYPLCSVGQDVVRSAWGGHCC